MSSYTTSTTFIDPTTLLTTEPSSITLSGTLSGYYNTALGTSALGSITTGTSTLSFGGSYSGYASYGSVSIDPYTGMTEVDSVTGIIKVFDGVEWQEVKMQDPNKIETEEEIVAKEFDGLLNNIKQEIYG